MAKNGLGIAELTATGIVPDSHRIPFRLDYPAKVKDFFEKKNSCEYVVGSYELRVAGEF